MAARPAARDEIDEFANAIGEWLLTQQFGTIKPLAFRHRMGWSPEREGEEAYVLIELLVNDPPPPPAEDEMRAMSREELAAALSWPLDDWQSVHEGAKAKGRELGPPPGIIPHWPVDVRMFPESKAERHGFALANA